MELARGIGDRRAVAGDDAGAAGAEGAPGRAGAGAVERRDIGKGGAGNKAAPIGNAGVVLVTQVKLGLLGIAGEHRNVAAALGKIGADKTIDLELAQVGALGAAELGIELGALEIGAQDVVDHAGHRIRPIERGSAIAQHLDPADGAHRNGVGVVAKGRHAGIDDAGDRLRSGVQHSAAAVDQQQRIALPEATQADSRDITARRVAAAAAKHLLVEGDTAQLRDGAKQIGTGNGGDGLDLLGADNADRERASGLGAENLRADDQDFFHFGGPAVRCGR